MDEPMISRRSEEFGGLFENIRTDLRTIISNSSTDSLTSEFQGECLILNGTGTMALEMSIANLCDQSTQVVIASNGLFGERLAEICKRYGNVSCVSNVWGKPLDIEAIRDTISDQTDLVAMVHNETSTGMVNPVETIGSIADENDSLFLVDGISSIGGMEFKFEDWNVDILVTDPQKALASPPGISILFASKEAISSFQSCEVPYYLDANKYLKSADVGRTPFTAATPLFRGLAVALSQILEEGMQNRIFRHRRYAKSFREGFREMGLDLFPEPGDGAEYSDTVTAVRLPTDVTTQDFEAELDKFGVSVGGSLQDCENGLFRVSNMGSIHRNQIIWGMYSIGQSFRNLGVSAQVPDSIATAVDIL